MDYETTGLITMSFRRFMVTMRASRFATDSPGVRLRIKSCFFALLSTCGNTRLMLTVLSFSKSLTGLIKAANHAGKESKKSSGAHE